MQNRQSRYRAEQINLVKVDGAITAHASIKTEFLLTLKNATDALSATVTLEDSVYDFHTTGSEKIAELLQATDRIKKRLIFSLDENGTPVRLLNLPEVREAWRTFKQDMSANGFSGSLGEEGVARFIEAGDIEYNSQEIILKMSGTSLFHKVVFGKHLRPGAECQGEVFDTQSHFFPQIRFDVHCQVSTQEESEESVTLVKVGKPLFVDKSRMTSIYEEIYRPKIGYKFTDHHYTYEVNSTVSKGDRLVRRADAAIHEAIKNNLEAQVIYKLRAVEL